MSAEPRPSTRWRAFALTTAAALALVASACSSGSAAPSGVVTTAAPAPTTATQASEPAPAGSAATGDTITMYTTVTQATVDAVTAAWSAEHPDIAIEVFRAPTAEVAARIATDLQTGPIGADVLWMTDPLSIEAYAEQGLLEAWQPENAAAIDPAYRTDTFFGTRILNMVLVTGSDAVSTPTDWHDLIAPGLKDAVAIPDPGFAGSAFAALAYLDAADGYGMDFYTALKAGGATQVKSPDEVTTGVAEGRFAAGMTLDNSVLTAAKKGSPVQMVWPSSGAIAIYSPIAVVAGAEAAPAAHTFVDFVLSAPGQAAIAASGWQPVVGPGGPTPQGTQVSPDWTSAFGTQTELLDGYRAIFGG